MKSQLTITRVEVAPGGAITIDRTKSFPALTASVCWSHSGSTRAATSSPSCMSQNCQSLSQRP